MTVFLRLLNADNKSAALETAILKYRAGETGSEVIEADVNSFQAIPGSPFSYWVNPRIRDLFVSLDPLEFEGRRAAIGLSTKYDARFVRAFWEVPKDNVGFGHRWLRYANGSKNSKHYVDYYVVVNGIDDFRELREYISWKFPYLKGNASWILHDENSYGDPVIGWPLRTGSFSPHLLPRGYVFSARTYAAFAPETELLPLHGLLSSFACDFLIKLSLGQSEGQPEFVTNAVRVLPIPSLGTFEYRLEELSRRAWSLVRSQNMGDEISHSFHLPDLLRHRMGEYDPEAINLELTAIQTDIDEIGFVLYGFSDVDRAAALGSSSLTDDVVTDTADDGEDSEDEDGAEAVDQTDALLSWAAGVAFGRFDWRLATGEREAPPEPDPFDPLPAKSPGMLPDDTEPFHAHSGILVDDQGHPDDLARLIEEVIARVDAPVPADVRRWLQRDFFPLHRKQYSKSRRKAPIYWPISTSSGSYTLWLYYPCLTDQTLFTAVNDFIEPKLTQVDRDVVVLRTKGSARSSDDEKTFEALQALELELIELRDTLLAIANTYRPNHDDGVPITAAPLWQLFRHKPWQKILKDTWAKLEKGDYDWAHLALAYWPDRVREKCTTDKSLAIAHDLEHLYVEPDPKPTKARGRKKDG